jgi:hypothetical protein
MRDFAVILQSFQAVHLLLDRRVLRHFTSACVRLRPGPEVVKLEQREGIELQPSEATYSVNTCQQKS